MARQRKVEIQEYDVGAKPCDTSSSALRPRTMQENMAVMGSLELHQAKVHHGTAYDVVVAGALNTRCVTRTSGSDTSTVRVHTGHATDSCLYIAPPQRLCGDSKLSQLHCPTHSKVSVWDNTPLVTRRGSNMAVPNLPPDVLADRPRVHQYTPARPTSRRGRLGTATLQPPPASSHDHFSE